MANIANQRFGTAEDVLQIYQISRSTLKRWILAGVISPSVRIGGIVRFDLDEVAQKLSDQSRTVSRRKGCTA